MWRPWPRSPNSRSSICTTIESSMLETLSIRSQALRTSFKDFVVRRSTNGLGNDVSTLDLSFNNLKHVPNSLGHLTSLRTIYFVQNRISRISGLEGLGQTLRSLELCGNRIRVTLVHFPFVRRLLPVSSDNRRPRFPFKFGGAMARKEQDYKTRGLCRLTHLDP